MNKKLILILTGFTMVLAACSGSGPASATAVGTVDAPGGTVGSPEGAAGGSVPKDLGDSFNLTIGTDSKPSVFPSYHIELTLDLPKPNPDFSAVVNEMTKISADVQGENIHIFRIDPGTAIPEEIIILGDTGMEYKMVDGSPQATVGQLALNWSFWKLKVVAPFAAGVSLHADKTGEEIINGRSAVRYEFDSSKGDPGAIAAIMSKPESIGFHQSKGTLWVDKETGGMLKLTLDYVTGVPNKDFSKSIGEGTGHIELGISKISQVTVTSPV
jgi:hypothetical protein